jgi:hypothetical protein
MTERLLQFIWQFQYFNKNELTASGGEDVQIIFPGQFNSNQGPDFINAKIKIDTTIWAGSVELHIKTSDWNKHHHQYDPNYNNVILHVVWEDDSSRRSASGGIPGRGTGVPVVELQSRISKILLQRYEELMNASSFIPCEKSIHSIRDIIWKSWKERLLAERLSRKAKTVETCLQQNNYHWEETLWWLLARNFGMKVNADAFEAIARSVSITMLAKQKHQVQQLEALLLGQAGLLKGTFKEDYPKLLQSDYTLHQRRYKLQYKFQPISVPVLFLRMRPGNFPTVRLAQLAMLIHESAHLFAKIKEADSLKDVKSLFDLTASDYWDYHYLLDEPSSFKKKHLGDAMIANIIINTVAPVLFAYGGYHGKQQYRDKAVQWLEETIAEHNTIIKGFGEINIETKNAFDSQALIELKNEYCDKKRCLECAVGNAILSTRVPDNGY